MSEDHVEKWMRSRPARLEPISLPERPNRLRRIILLLGGAGAATLAVGAYTAGSKSEQVERESGEEHDVRKHRLEALQNSPSFKRNVDAYRTAYGEVELEIRINDAGEEEEVELPPTFQRVLDRSEADRHHGLSAADYLRRYALQHQPGIAKAVREELTFFVSGLVSRESKYDNNKPGDLITFTDPQDGVRKTERAQGRIQARPSTARFLRIPEQRLKELPTQALFLGEHFKWSYDTLQQQCSTALDTIAREYFSGNREEMERRFLTPAIVNAYITGPGTIVTIVQAFAALSSAEREVGTGPYGVFDALVAKAVEKNFSANYGPTSASYVYEAFAASYLFERSRLRRS